MDLHAEDDPLNDALEAHQQWGPILDPADYDTDGIPTGASGSDIGGVPSQVPRWQAVEPYTLGTAADTAATTTIVDDVSRVLFLCPDEGGDVFSIQVGLVVLHPVLVHARGARQLRHRLRNASTVRSERIADDPLRRG